MAEGYEVGTRAWQPDPTEGWVASEVIKKTVEGDKVKLEFKLENGEVSRSCVCPDRAIRLVFGTWIAKLPGFCRLGQ